MKIIKYWSRLNKVILPHDIINILIIFSKISTVYTTNNERNSWTVLRGLNDANIIKISGDMNIVYCWKQMVVFMD